MHGKMTNSLFILLLLILIVELVEKQCQTL